MHQYVRGPKRGRLEIALRILGAVLLAALVRPADPCASAQYRKAAPKTRTQNVRDVLHGVEIVDPYRWLEDQESAETRSWIDAQNRYTQMVLARVPGRDALKRRITEFLKLDTQGVPLERQGRYFFTRRLSTQELPVIYLRKGRNGPDEVLIDPHPLSPDRTTSVSLQEVSEDGSLLVYGVRRGGEDEVAYHFFDVDTRTHLTDRLPRGRYSGIGLRTDRRGFYYARHGDQGPRLFYHEMGSDSSQDREIFGKGYGKDKFIRIKISDDGRFLLIIVYHGSSAGKSEVYCLNLDRPAELITVVNDLDAKFEGEFGGDQLFLKTNWNAPNERILAVDLRDPKREAWRVVVPETGMPIERMYAFGGKLILGCLKDVVMQLKVFEPDGTLIREVAMPSIGAVGALQGSWKKREAFYSFSSFLVPTEIYRYDIDRGERERWARVDGRLDSDRFEVKQVWYPSKDRTKIPMFIVHRKGMKLDGSHPTLLYGYGGFRASFQPGFSSRAAMWVDAGGVYAMANIRGGGEFGEDWHRAGMLEKKQNVFDDFIAAAEWLIEEKYTKASRLAISGESNGGLLVGAALTQRPELFRAVICSFPLLDMIRYHQFLVARLWVPEYGSSENPEQFKVLHAYSPYHQVKRGVKYPAVLFVSGDADTRVAPLHARKMAARLQGASGGSGRPVLLHYDTKAGHAGGRPVTKEIDDLTDELGFLCWQLRLGIGQP